MMTTLVQKTEDTESKTELNILKTLNELQDTRAINLLINILSKIIQNPEDKAKQDLNYQTIHNKIGDCKPAFDVLFASGFQRNEDRLKINVNSNNIPRIKYIYNEIIYKHCDRSREYRQQFNCRNLMKSHPPKYWNRNKQFIFKTICANTYNNCMGTMIYSRHKLMPLPATIPDPTEFLTKKVTIASNIYDYVSNETDPTKLHFYVNFADSNLFGFYGGALFAQDEIMTTEHPILGSLRERIRASKDRNKLSPDCDGAVVILNAIKHGHFNQEKLNKIYGNRFQIASEQTLLDAVQVCKPPLIDNIICIASLRNCRVKYETGHIVKILQKAYCGFNGAKSEAMYQTLKRLRNKHAVASVDECDHNQLMWLLDKHALEEGKLLENKDLFLRYFTENKLDGKAVNKMNRKDFAEQIVQFGDNRKLRATAVKLFRLLLDSGDLIDLGVFDGYQADKQDDDEKKEEVDRSLGTDMPKLVLHTGNWGCGAFGGNIELHFILQAVAAVAAGFDEMYYHAVDDKAMIQAVTGLDVLLKELFPDSKDKKGKFKRDLFIAQVLKRGYVWGTPNGT